MIKLSFLCILCFCPMQAMDLPMPIPAIEQFESSISFNLYGTVSPMSSVYNSLMNIVLETSISSSEKKKLDSQTLGINAIAFKLDGSLFCSVYNNLIEPTVKIFSSAGDSHVLCKNEQCSTSCAAFSHDGTVLLCGSGKSFYFWDTASWKLCRTLSLDEISDIRTLALSKDGHKIIVGGDAGVKNLTIITKKSSGTSIATLPGHKKKWITVVGFSPDTTRAISVSENVFKIWDIARLTLIRKEKGKSWSRCKIEYAGDNQWFLSGVDHAMEWWFLYDLNSEKKTIIPLLGKRIPRIGAYDRSACGNYIFLGGADKPEIMIFNVRTKQHVHTIVENGIGISALMCSPNGKYLTYALKKNFETDLCMRNIISNEDQDVLQTVYSFVGDRIAFIQRLIGKARVHKETTLGNKNADHITFDGLPNTLKVFLQKYVVSGELQDEHDFTMLNTSVIGHQDKDQDDEWIFLG